MERELSSPIEVLVIVPYPDTDMQALRELSSRLRITLIPAREIKDIPNDVWVKTNVLYTDHLLPPPELVPELRWVQLHFAGVDFVSNTQLLQMPEVIITTLSGAAAPQMAEYALTMLLALSHRLPELHVGQERTEWPRDRWERYRPVELRTSTVGIVGYGSIGRELARLLRALGSTVLATKRDVMHPADSGYIIPGLGDPGGDMFHRLYPSQAVKSMFKECDFVVVGLPATPETRGLIGAEELAALKPSAYLVNIARGGIVDQSALITALQEKRLAGAALDVFTEEPLHVNSPLWKMPNVIISPHIGGMSVNYNRRALDLFTENIKRYLAGSLLLNRYDVKKGY